MKNGGLNIIKRFISEGFYTGLLERTSSRQELENFLIRFASSLVFVILMWISANSFMYLPFTPVPLTMQVMTVLLSALTMGGYWAAFTQAEYIILGLAGAPVFAGFRSGFVAISGPTGGFILGFIVAAFASGLMYEGLKKRFDQSLKDHKYANRVIAFVSCIAGILIIYSFGYLHFAGYLSTSTGYSGIGGLLIAAFDLSVAPFIIFDLVKVFVILATVKISKLDF